MKKSIVILVLLATLGLGQAVALGIGAAAGLPLGDGLPGANVILSIKPTDSKEMPLIGIGASGGSPTNALLTLDWWFINEPLAGSLNVYAGVGAYGVIVGDQGFAAGGRIPIGLNIFPLRWIEIFVEIDPSLGINFINNKSAVGFGMQSSFGIRFWFK